MQKIQKLLKEAPCGTETRLALLMGVNPSAITRIKKLGAKNINRQIAITGAYNFIFKTDYYFTDLFSEIGND